MVRNARAKAPTATAQSEPLTRRDAARNRSSLLNAAQTVMARQGIQAPLEEIARTAGLGIGTLYRHFPNRTALIEALFADEFGDYVRAAEEGLAHADPWEGLCHYLWRVGELQASQGRVREFLVVTLPGAEQMDLLHRELLSRLQQLIERAQAQGSLRGDVVAPDLGFIAWSTLEVLSLTEQSAPQAWRRHMALMIDGLRADGAHPLGGPPLTEQQLIEAMRRQQGKG